MHEPRGKKSLALAYATARTGPITLKPTRPLYEEILRRPAPTRPARPSRAGWTCSTFSPKKVRAFTYAQKLWSDI